jgi:hypothetical protein
MKRRPVDLELTLTNDEFQGLKKLRKASVDYRTARLVVEDVFVRQIVEKLPDPEIEVAVVMHADESISDVESEFREALRAARGWRW